jgi:hypothetical protein
MVVVRAANRTIPFTHTQFEFWQDVVAVGTLTAGGVKTVNDLDP